MANYKPQQPQNSGGGGSWYIYCGDNKDGWGMYLRTTGKIERHDHEQPSLTYFKSKKKALRATERFLRPVISLDFFKEPEDA